MCARQSVIFFVTIFLAAAEPQDDHMAVSCEDHSCDEHDQVVLLQTSFEHLREYQNSTRKQLEVNNQYMKKKFVAGDDDNPVVSANADTSVMLIGMMTTVIGAFYLVNSPSPIVVDNTWSMISTAVSIFIAVLTNDIMTTCITALFSTASGTPSPAALIAAAVQWVSFWLLVVVAFYLMKSNPLHLKGYGTVFGHILGFAGINLFGLISLSKPWSNSPWFTIPVYLIYVVAFLLLFVMSFLYRKSVMKFHEVSEEDADRWHEQSVDTGTDFYCMTGSWIVSFFIRYLIINPAIPSIDGTTDGRTIGHVFVLLVVGFLLLILAGVLGFLTKFVTDRKTLMDVSKTLVSLTSAWCFLFATDWWAFFNFGATVMTRVFVADIFSFVALCFILLMVVDSHYGCIPDAFMTSMFSAISLTVGMGWEKTFDACMDGLGDFLGGGSNDTLCKTAVQILFVAIAFPAWCVYMLPKADDELKKLPPQQFWVALPGFQLKSK